ncbi:hypothetical protein G3480_17295 [Thiorhodococcus mannitoliphagus]|uniref:Lipoprotein n=1 Tax=Thiorhodococcus mannitoliphagus TaxID=329406 RepID=A0A6P1DX42_9GAMM|nr:hypothetical protein [Thiorhodococcus mannitoliphagus]NEX22040.1 hypothetical protein [Thiorhodococcus mannitoliphagus]
MTSPFRPLLIVAAATSLAACVSDGGTYDSGAGSAMRQASSGAESACMSAVNGNYGGNVGTVKVASSEFSQANSVVMVDAVGVRGGSQTERWKCLVSSDGAVQELTVVQ